MMPFPQQLCYGMEKESWIYPNDAKIPPLERGGPKVIDDEFLQHDLECLLPNKNGIAQPFMVNIFAPVEYIL